MGKISKEDPQRVRLLECSKCGESYIVTHVKEKPRFCLICGHSFEKLLQEEEPVRPSGASAPKKSEVLFTMGDFQITQKIGQGGMGEVFTAYDTASGRKVALKRIREDIPKVKGMQERFLREAYVTCQLSHPSIIPIYAIHKEKERSFYTMPYVEGETLKQRLRKIREEEKEGSIEHTTASIMKLVRLFLQICHAVAYAHIRGLLHRDIKPENILLGKYGEVFLHDWGISLPIEEAQKPGRKLSGTFSYLPPERAMGTPDSIQSDLFALGVVLYQILTLKMPFQRKTAKEFKEKADSLIIPHPQKAAPFRDIPDPLSEIALKALAKNPSERFQSVLELIEELEIFMEGGGKFHPTYTLQPSREEDWEFQDKVLFFEHAAITRHPEGAEWVFLMISKQSFGQNIRQKICGQVASDSNGIGILLFAEGGKERKNPFEGLTLFLSTEPGESRLLRAGAEILPFGDFILPKEKKFEIVIEQRSDRFQLFVDGQEVLTYVHHLPQRGNRLGLIAKEMAFTIDEWTIFEAFPNVMIHCLAIPNAFLAHRDYKTAFIEYQKIAQSFPGHTEEREAFFRAGITLLEEAKETTLIDHAHELFKGALNEFKKLRETPAAPLELLGKALVWRTIGDLDEEAKCFGLALHAKSHHPFRDRIEEELLFRLMEASLYERKEAYLLLLLVVKQAPRLLERDTLKAIIKSLEKGAEIPYFFEPLPKFSESLQTLELFLLFWLGHSRSIRTLINHFPQEEPLIKKSLYFALEELGLKTALEETFSLENEKRSLILKLRKWLEWQNWDLIIVETKKFSPMPLDLSLITLEALLFKGEYAAAQKEFERYSFEELSTQDSILPFLYGCYLSATENEEIAGAHFGGILESTYPRSWNLGRAALREKLSTKWFSTAFLWEKRQLARQMGLYFHCKGDAERSLESLNRLKDLVPVDQ